MIIKICGITHPDDAKISADGGADWIGVVCARSSKRYVPIPVACDIAAVSQKNGVRPVAVFAEEGIDEMRSVLEETGIQTVQLHGENSLKYFSEFSPDIQVIPVFPVDARGKVSRSVELPQGLQNRKNFLLYDHLNPGEGKTFPWDLFKPDGLSSWILAGGLNPENIGVAIEKLRPDGVDVSTGVCYTGSTRKDPRLLEKFIQKVREFTHE